MGHAIDGDLNDSTILVRRHVLTSVMNRRSGTGAAHGRLGWSNHGTTILWRHLGGETPLTGAVDDPGATGWKLPGDRVPVRRR